MESTTERIFNSINDLSASCPDTALSCFEEYLAAFSECPSAVEAVTKAKENFDIIDALSTCFSSYPPSLPYPADRMITIVTCLFFKLSDGEIPLDDLLSQIYTSEDNKYACFLRDFLTPLKVAYCEMYNLPYEADVKQEVSDSLEEELQPAIETEASDGATETTEETAVTLEDTIVPLPTGDEYFDRAMELTSAIKRDLPNNPYNPFLQEVRTMLEGLYNAILLQDKRLVKLLWIGFRNTAVLARIQNRSILDAEEFFENKGVTE